MHRGGSEAEAGSPLGSCRGALACRCLPSFLPRPTRAHGGAARSPRSSPSRARKQKSKYRFIRICCPSNMLSGQEHGRKKRQNRSYPGLNRGLQIQSLPC